MRAFRWRGTENDASKLNMINVVFPRSRGCLIRLADPAVRTRPRLRLISGAEALTAGADAESSCRINNIMKGGVGTRKRGRKC